MLNEHIYNMETNAIQICLFDLMLEEPIIVMGIPSVAFLQHQSSLHYVGNSTEASSMLGPVMTELLLHCTKDLEFAIDSLMARSQDCLHVLLSCVVASRSDRPSV